MVVTRAMFKILKWQSIFDELDTKLQSKVILEDREAEYRGHNKEALTATSTSSVMFGQTWVSKYNTN